MQKKGNKNGSPVNQKNSSLLDILIAAGAVCLLLVSVLASASSLYWRFSLLDHPRPQYLIAALLGLIYLLLRKHRFAWIALAVVVINGWLIAPIVFGRNPPSPTATTLTISHINLDRDKVAALDYLASRNDDILFLQELTPTLADALNTRLPDHRLIIAEPRWSTHGSAMLVHNNWQGEVISAEITHIPSNAERPLIHAQIELNGKQLNLLSLHTTRPTSKYVYWGQSAEFEAVAAWSNNQIASGNNLLIIGDFNTTSWAANFRRLLQDGNLQDGMRGHGTQFSWPGNLPLPLRIPIDLAAHSKNIQINRLQTGDYLGSDHLPLYLQVALK